MLSPPMRVTSRPLMEALGMPQTSSVVVFRPPHSETTPPASGSREVMIGRSALKMLTSPCCRCLFAKCC